MKYKEFFKKAVSVTTSVATVLVLSGVASLVAPGVALAANEGTSEDITGDDPRIAPDGESERVFLGLNLLRDDNSDTIELDAVRVTLDGIDTAAHSGDDSEAAAATIEKVKVYKDSALSGTNGEFDSADGLVKQIDRNSSSVASLSNDESVGTTTIELDDVGDISDGDKIRIGTSSTAEIREATSTASSPVTLTTGLTYSHSSGDPVFKVSNSRVSDAAEGFESFSSSGSTTIVELGQFDNGTGTSDLGEGLPKDDTGDNAGNDFFIVLETKDGTADMEIKAQVHNNDVQYINETQNTKVSKANLVSSESGTTNGKTKAVTYGADGVAPGIDSVTTKDSNGDGRVDQFVAVFSESMSTNVSSTEHFTDALGSSTSSAVEAGNADVTLESNSEWSTTNNTNDTLTMDVTNEANYSDSHLSTGDSFTVVYDQDNSNFSASNRLKDTTGEELTDESIATTDGAGPSVDPADGSGINNDDSATVHDLDGNGEVDELRVRTSETLSTDSTADGFTLKNTSQSGNPEYNLTGVNGFETDDGSNSNSNDTIKLAVEESGSSDVDDTFTLSYTKQNSGGILDTEDNSAPSDSTISIGTGVTPVITKAETADDGNLNNTSNNNGQIDRVTLTFTCDVTESGTTTEDWTVSGYTVSSTSDGSGKTFHLEVEESGVDDTDATPDVTYTDDGETSSDDINCGDTNFNLEAVSAGDVTEEDAASPQLQSVKMYEDDNDDVWDNGETLQLVFSEEVDSSTVETSWNTSGADGSVWTDWLLEDSGGSTRGDAFVPDSGTISVSGKVVTLTAGEDASSALTSNDQLSVVSNEVKDSASNSAAPTGSGNGVSVTVTPTSAPSVSKIETKDLDGNGILDAFHVHFDGLVDASTLTTSDWEAARGANFDFNTNDEQATASSEVDPDLTVTSVETESGGNDSVVVVHYDEASEGTGDHPQVKYVKGDLTDLAGNEVSTFNAASDESQFETTITNDSEDGAAPLVVHKRLKDRDDNGKYDQLVVVFSEGIDDDSTASDDLANGSHSSDGWDVEDHNLSSSGSLDDNDGTYDAYTFETTNVVFKVDILEDGAPTEVPDVTYSSTGNFKDKHHNNVLADVSAGDEVSDIAVVDVSDIADGDLMSVDGDEDVYIAKRVGDKKFKRLILNPDIFNSYGHLEWGNIKSVTQNELDQFETSNLIKEDGTEPVFEVSSSPGADTGQKQHLNMSASEFESCGYDWDAIYTVNSTEASDSFYPQGSDITDC